MILSPGESSSTELIDTFDLFTNDSVLVRVARYRLSFRDRFLLARKPAKHTKYYKYLWWKACQKATNRRNDQYTYLTVKMDWYWPTLVPMTYSLDRPSADYLVFVVEIRSALSFEWIDSVRAFRLWLFWIVFLVWPVYRTNAALGLFDTVVIRLSVLSSFELTLICVALACVLGPL